VRVGVLSVMLLFVLAVTASVATPIVGVLLTFAILVGPAATAALVSARPARAVALAVALSVAYMWIGLAVSYWIDFPPSVFVTALAFAGYLAARGGHAWSHSRLAFRVHAPAG
jgi:zinc/manganese transport system permease protein